MKHRARKRFGQNFLSDESIINSIIQAINPKPGDNIIEIGPGLGALTYRLLELSGNCRAVEIDRDLIQHLNQTTPAYGQLDIISDDVLNVDFSQFGEKQRVIGNLPYNISTPLLLHLLDSVSFISDMYFMMQKEVVERLAAQPHSKAYGRLTVMVQYFCQVEKLIEVPPHAFDPSPKVTSAVVKLIPYKESPYETTDIENLKKTLITAFGQRRKTLRNNFKKQIDEKQWQQLGIEAGLRPEALDVSDYVKISNHLKLTTST